jgi:hypothetical protein
MIDGKSDEKGRRYIYRIVEVPQENYDRKEARPCKKNIA